jgi:hypothetical protein
LRAENAESKGSKTAEVTQTKSGSGKEVDEKDVEPGDDHHEWTDRVAFVVDHESWRAIKESNRSGVIWSHCVPGQWRKEGTDACCYETSTFLRGEETRGEEELQWQRQWRWWSSQAVSRWHAVHIEEDEGKKEEMEAGRREASKDRGRLFLVKQIGGLQQTDLRTFVGQIYNTLQREEEEGESHTATMASHQRYILQKFLQSEHIPFVILSERGSHRIWKGGAIRTRSLGSRGWWVCCQESFSDLKDRFIIPLVDDWALGLPLPTLCLEATEQQQRRAWGEMSLHRDRDRGVRRTNLGCQIEGRNDLNGSHEVALK